MKTVTFLLIFLSIYSFFGQDLLAQSSSYELKKTISSDIIIRDASVTKDYFLYTHKNIEDNLTTIIARNFDGVVLFKVERDERNTGSIFSSPNSDFFGIVNFDRSEYYDNEYMLDYISYDIYNSKGEFFDTVSTDSGLDLFFKENQVTYVSRSGFVKILGRNSLKNVSGDNGLAYHSFGDSLLLFINYNTKTVGKKGFENVLEKQKEEMYSFRDSTKVLNQELKKLRRNPRVSRDLFQEWTQEFQEKIKLERSELVTKYSLKRGEYNIQLLPESNLILYSPIKDSTYLEVPISLSKSEGFNGNVRLQHPRVLASAISESYLVSTTNINNGLGDVSIFSRVGKRVHILDLQHVNRMKIVSDSLLFIRTASNGIHLYDLKSGMQIWKRVLPKEYRYKILNHQNTNHDKIYVLLGEEIELNKYSLSIGNIDLRNGEFINFIPLDNKLDDFHEVKEIENGFIYVQNEQVSENKFESKIMIYQAQN